MSLLQSGIVAAILFTSIAAQAAHSHPEKAYQAKWCSDQNGVVEYVLDDQTRVDCLTSDYAIEFDFAPKWAEAIGQALYYAMKTGRKPGVVLIMEKESDGKHHERLQQLAERYSIRVWQMAADAL